MILGIDASNIRAGGGLTHLSQILKAADPPAQGFSEVLVWGAKCSLERMPLQKSWLRLIHDPLLDKSLPHRLRWQRTRLPKLAKGSCDLLFSPGARDLTHSGQYVTLSQNMLPFEFGEAMRYGPSWMFARLLMLRLEQGRAFRNANGVIFLSNYACGEITKKVSMVHGKRVVIPHGIEKRFFRPPSPQRHLAHCSTAKPFRLLYVSIVDVYKHQWLVAEAIAEIRKHGLPVELEYMGPAYGPALRRLRKAMHRLDPEQRFLHYRGPIRHEELHLRYQQADAFIFASSCENLPNIVLEAMASGLPIACSNRGPMPEVLGDAGLYFDPEKPAKIGLAVQTLLEDPDLRARCAGRAYQTAQAYSWKKCASETFSFFKTVGQRSHS